MTSLPQPGHLRMSVSLASIIFVPDMPMSCLHAGHFIMHLEQSTIFLHAGHLHSMSSTAATWAHLAHLKHILQSLDSLPHSEQVHFWLWARMSLSPPWQPVRPITNINVMRLTQIRMGCSCSTRRWAAN